MMAGKLAWGLLVPLWLSGCATGASQARLDALRKDANAKQQRVDALARENTVLREEKADAESDLASLRKISAAERRLADAERLAHREDRRRADSTLRLLADSLGSLRSRFAGEMDSLDAGYADRIDSLKRRLDDIVRASLRDSLAQAAEIRNLKDSLSAERNARERERFAADRMQETLFRRLADEQKELDRLRIFLPSTTSAGSPDSQNRP